MIFGHCQNIISVSGLCPVDIVILSYVYNQDTLLIHVTVTPVFLELFLAAILFIETVFTEEISYNCKFYSTADVVEQTCRAPSKENSCRHVR